MGRFCRQWLLSLLSRYRFTCRNTALNFLALLGASFIETAWSWSWHMVNALSIESNNVFYIIPTGSSFLWSHLVGSSMLWHQHFRLLCRVSCHRRGLGCKGQSPHPGAFHKRSQQWPNMPKKLMGISCQQLWIWFRTAQNTSLCCIVGPKRCSPHTVCHGSVTFYAM